MDLNEYRESKFILAFFKHGICRSDSFKKTNKNYKLFILKKAINFKSGTYSIGGLLSILPE